MSLLNWLISELKGNYQLSSLIPLNQIAIGIGVAYLALPHQRYARNVMDIIERYSAQWNHTYKNNMAEDRDAAISALHVMKALDFHSKYKAGTFFGLKNIEKRCRPSWMSPGLHLDTLDAKDCAEATLKGNSYFMRDMFSQDVTWVTIFTSVITLLTIYISFSEQKVAVFAMFLGILVVFGCSVYPAYCVMRGREYVERCNDATITLDFWLKERKRMSTKKKPSSKPEALL